MYYPYRQQVSRAYAAIQGSEYPTRLRGYVVFTDLPNGTEVTVEVSGLPYYEPARGDQAPIGPRGLPIHENGDCEVGDESDPFQGAGGQWNPTKHPLGNQPGYFPVLFSNNGYARMSFFTNKFKAQDVVDKSIIIHLNPDDYRSQPSGDSGKRIGCGVIKAY